MELHFSVPGKPMGKQRPKFARRGRFITTYTPKQTREYEERVKIEYNKAHRGDYFEGPLEIDITGIFPVPSSISKKKSKELIGTVHDKKPDCDNMAKIILDPLNKLAYNDDGQVSKLNVTKIYGEEPKVEVTIRQINLVNTTTNPIICPLIFLDRFPEPAIYTITNLEENNNDIWIT